MGKLIYTTTLKQEYNTITLKWLSYSAAEAFITKCLASMNPTLIEITVTAEETEEAERSEEVW